MKSPVRLGIFIAFTLAAAGAAVFLIGGNGLWFGSGYRLYANFDNVAGLEGGAPVQVGGLQQGSVKNIFLPTRAGMPIRVEMRLKRASRNVIRLDSQATISPQGLVGEQYVEISMGSPQYPAVRDGDTIHGKTAPQISELITHADAVLDRMNGALGNITDITGKMDRGEGTLGALLNDPSLYHRFDRAAANVEDITGKLNSGQGSLGKLLNDPSLYHRFDQAAANIEDVTGKLNSGQGSLGKLLNDPSLYRHFDRAAGNIEDITGKLSSGKGSLGAMLTDRSLYDHFNSAAGNLDALTGKINNGQGTLGQLITNPSLFTHLNRAAENFQDDSEALKHNFLLRGYFKHRGYYDDRDIGQHAIAALPAGQPAQSFNVPGAQVFRTKSEADVDHGKLLEEAGKYLQSHPYSMAVVTAKGGLGGDTDTGRKLTEARAYAAREWLVKHFQLDDSRIKTLGMGLTPGVPPTGELSIMVYTNVSPPGTGAADRADPAGRGH